MPVMKYKGKDGDFKKMPVVKIYSGISEEEIDEKVTVAKNEVIEKIEEEIGGALDGTY